MDLTSTDASHRVRRWIPGQRVPVITSIVALIRIGQQPACLWVLAANALYAVLIAQFVRAEQGPIGRGSARSFRYCCSPPSTARWMLSTPGAIPHP
jgi:hypothetical protein